MCVQLSIFSKTAASGDGYEIDSFPRVLTSLMNVSQNTQTIYWVFINDVSETWSYTDVYIIEIKNLTIPSNATNDQYPKPTFLPFLFKFLGNNAIKSKGRRQH